MASRAKPNKPRYSQSTKEQMMATLAPAIKRVATIYHHKTQRKFLVEDLEQVAAMECWKLLDRFDEARGLKLATYFGRRIRGAMQDYLRKFGYLLNGGARTGRAEHFLQIAGTDRLPKKHEPNESIVVVADQRASRSQLDDRDAFEHLLRNLTQQEKQCLRLYFREGLTMKEASRILNLSESRVSQITSEAISRLRRYHLAAN